MRYLTITFTLIILYGCATLDAQSNFDSSIKDIKHLNGYSQVTSNSYRPEMVALTGAAPTKGSLYFIANQASKPNAKTPPASKIKLEVSYLKNYSEYTTFTLNGQSQNVINEFPVFETCSDLCINTQYLQLPISNETLRLATKDGLSFVLSSSNETTMTRFDIAAGYIAAITEQFTMTHYTANKKESPAPFVIAEGDASLTNTPSSFAEGMVKYWFNEASEAEKQRFLDWALVHRKNSEAVLKSEVRTIDMMSYWHRKLKPEQRKVMLTWLLYQ